MPYDDGGVHDNGIRILEEGGLNAESPKTTGPQLTANGPCIMCGESGMLVRHRTGNPDTCPECRASDSQPQGSQST